MSVAELVTKVAAREKQVRDRPYIAPIVEEGQRIRVRIDGLIQNYETIGAGEGWWKFRLTSDYKAIRLEEATHLEIAKYLEPLPRMRFILSHKLENRTWLAYAFNESEAIHKLGSAKPVPIRLVGPDLDFDAVIACIDGSVLWYEEQDRRFDPRFARKLREHLKNAVLPKDLPRFPGMIPEMRTAYEIASQHNENFPEVKRRREETRIKTALQLTGGSLHEIRDQTDVWQVTWTTRTGVVTTSIVRKTDLAVVSAGLCLSGRDRDFDLHSLVGVVEKRRGW